MWAIQRNNITEQFIKQKSTLASSVIFVWNKNLRNMNKYEKKTAYFIQTNEWMLHGKRLKCKRQVHKQNGRKRKKSTHTVTVTVEHYSLQYYSMRHLQFSAFIQRKTKGKWKIKRNI